MKNSKINELFRILTKEESQKHNKTLEMIKPQFEFYSNMLELNSSFEEKEKISDEYIEPDSIEEPPKVDEEPSLE